MRANRGVRFALAVAVSATLDLVLAGEARAQVQPGSDPSATTPQSPQNQWPRLSDEELQLAPPPQAKPPEPVIESLPVIVVEPAAPRFGEPGEIVISGDSSIGVSSTEYSDSKASAFNVSFAPAVDVFVVRGLSVGVDVNLRYSSSNFYGADGKLTFTGVTTLAGGSRLGFNVPLGDLVSWYPRVTIGLESVRLEVQQAKTTSKFDSRPSQSTDTGLFVSAFAPLLVHPKPHFFVGVGPSVLHKFGGPEGGPQIGVERTTIAARFVVGGWWGGPEAAPEIAPPLPSPIFPARVAPRFGASREWVFTGELGGAIAQTARTGAGESTLVSFVPGFDYFVGGRISLGMSATAASSKTILTTPSGDRMTNDASLLAAGVRIGVDYPFSSLFSFYPRLSVSAGRESFDERSGSSRYRGSTTVVTFGLYAPILVHVATHAFVGLGPSLAHDVIRRPDDRDVDNIATRVGGSLLVGGWL